MNNLIAHRGNNNSNCENRLNCLKEALNYDYISGIEVDIRETQDHKLILSHNSFLKKDFKLYFISKYKYKTLKKYIFKLKGNSFSINKLEDLLSNIHSNKIILLDIKDNININNLYKIIKKYKYLNIYICSFNYNFVYNLKNKYPKLKVGLIIGYCMNNNKNIDIFDFISINYYNLNKYNKPYFIWTINKKRLVNNIENSIGIITDNSYNLNKKEY